MDSGPKCWDWELCGLWQVLTSLRPPSSVSQRIMMPQRWVTCSQRACFLMIVITCAAQERVWSLAEGGQDWGLSLL